MLIIGTIIWWKIILHNRTITRLMVIIHNTTAMPAKIGRNRHGIGICIQVIRRNNFRMILKLIMSVESRQFSMTDNIGINKRVQKIADFQLPCRRGR